MRDFVTSESQERFLGICTIVGRASEESNILTLYENMSEAEKPGKRSFLYRIQSARRQKSQENVRFSTEYNPPEGS